MQGALVPDDLAAAFIPKDPFLLPTVFAMDCSEACTDFKLLIFRFLLHAASGASDHPGMIFDLFAGAVAFVIACPIAAFPGKLSLPPD